MEEMLGVKRRKMRANDKPDDGLNELRALLRCTDEIYVGVDQKFTEKGMKFVPCPGQTRHVNRHAVNDVFLEVLVKQLVPFREKVTENAVWTALGQFAMQPLQSVKDVYGQVDFYAQNSQETTNTMMISYSAALPGFRSMDLLSVRIRKAVRKYVEENRTVFICRMETQPQHTSGRTGVKQRISSLLTTTPK
ncbi:Hypothetical protein PHPALM_21182 [Phytophthora palmivora]|uniref:Uncharacterized protein n=1 Tax=Phytophthora palmivora TaxID=4796 RepID=A0A2P4XCZ8_9STRA|nr:Hypothetical protein PHPALM_21182 [Phytophthora palmivora]